MNETTRGDYKAIDIHKDLHYRLKVASVIRGVSIRELASQLLDEALKKAEER
jgi:hypothetical protein